VRTTVQNQKIDFHEYHLVDTPGINAKQEDTEEAEKAYRDADIILFIHNILEGELTWVQVDFLRNLITCFGADSYFWKRFIFVGTNADQKSEEESANIKNLILSQIKSEFAQVVGQFYLVDSLTHLKGVAENKQLLIDSSGIYPLLTAIDNLAEVAKAEKSMLLQAKMRTMAGEALQLVAPDPQNNDDKTASNVASLEESLKKLKSLDAFIKKQCEEQVNILNKEESDGVSVKSYHHIYISVSARNTYSDYEYSSSSSAESEGLDSFRTYCYSKAKSELDEYFDKALSLADKYTEYQTSANNPYYEKVKAAQESLLKIKQESVANATLLDDFKVDKLEVTLNTRPQGASYNESEARSKLYDYPSASEYRNYIKTDDSEVYVDGWFGESKKTRYKYDNFRAETKFCEKLTRCLENAENKLKSQLDRAYTSFIANVKQEYTGKIAPLQTALDNKIKQLTDQLIAEKQKLAENAKSTQPLLDLLRELI
jgi:hypothetical protein